MSARYCDIIGVADGVCGGRPLVGGARIEPRHLHAYADQEDSPLKGRPGLMREQILAAFSSLAR